jgi:Fimbrial assembly protein (PilN)
MGKLNLNLSTRPFPAYRIVNLGLMISFVVIAGLSLWQVYSYRDYSNLVRSIQGVEKSASVDKESLGTRMDALSTRLDRPVTTAKLAEIDFLNNLIVKKHFSWTQVFANLERVMPDNVHLTSISPEITKDKVKLHFITMCRSISDESEFIRKLQSSPVFQDVVVAREEKKGTGINADVQVDMTVSYFPERATQ